MRMVLAALLAFVCGGIAGSGIASVYLTLALRWDILTTDLMLHYRSAMAGLWSEQPYLTAHLIVAGLIAFLLLVAVATVLWDRLVGYGERRFQSPSELRRNGMVQPVGHGFVLGERIAAPTQRPNRPVKIRARRIDPARAMPTLSLSSRRTTKTQNPTDGSNSPTKSSPSSAVLPANPAKPMQRTVDSDD